MPATTNRGKPTDSPNAGRRFPPEVLSGAEVRALLEACGDCSPTHARDRAPIAILYRGGSESPRPSPSTPRTWRGGAGAVGHGRPGQDHRVDPGAFRLVVKWMRFRTDLCLDARYPLFCTPQGGAVSNSYIRRLPNNLGEQAGILMRAHPHWIPTTRGAHRGPSGQRRWARASPEPCLQPAMLRRYPPIAAWKSA